MDKTEAARKMFAADRFATETTGIVIEAAEADYARCTLDVAERHLNANGHVMGGVLFTLADFTFAVAANSGEDTSAVTIASNMQFLRAAQGRRLLAEAKCLKSGRSTCVMEVTITDVEKNRTVAKATVTGLRRG